MKTKLYYFIILCCSVLFSACAANDVVMDDAEKSTLVKVGDIAPDFTVDLLSGQSVTLSSLQGQSVLLVFFATWCGDCHPQLALLDAVNDRFGDKAFKLIAISKGEKVSDVRDYIQRKGYGFDVAVDSDSSIYSMYATQYVPRCFVIDPLGRIVAMSAEYDKTEFELLLKVVSSLLGVE